MARLADIVIDCASPAALARFWAAALDGYAVAPYDEEELARLRALGIDDPEDDPTVLLESADGPRLWLVRVPEPKTVKNRVHVDLRADDTTAELSRLVSLGATKAPDQPNDGLVVLLDPEGNEFCFLKG
jgi:hypothetical protein